MIFNKKATLELSINAIVVLILAITILGLGLGFIRGQFGQLEEQFSKVSSDIQNQIIEDIKKSGDLVSFSRLTFESVKAGTKNDFYFGMKSTETSRDTCFYVEFACENAIGQPCPPVSMFSAPLGVPSLSSRPSGVSIASGWNWFSTLQGNRVRKGDVKVLKGLLQASNSPSTTYNARVYVWKHYIVTGTTAAVPADYVYPDTGADGGCLTDPITNWPAIKEKDATTASGTPTITTAGGKSRNVELHDSKEFFIELV